MLKRKIETALKEWKEGKNQKCLIVNGPRQAGKTFSIREFGANNYDEIIEINFKETPSAAEIFSGDLDVNTLIMALRFRFPEKSITPEKALIFLDEIQECPEAITSLKFWATDNRYDVICSGSLLGIDYKRASSYPVGYVDHIQMNALDFEEFLWAMQITDEMVNDLEDMFINRRIVPESVHSRMMELFRTYLAVGGMPEVVREFITSHDFREVDKIQKNILQGYLYDIAHYATAEEKTKAEKCYLSLTRQLLDKENHKFQYKEVEKGGRAQKYYSSVEWLIRADIANICKLVTNIRYDLSDYARDDFFRLYTTDLSLLIAMRDFSFKQYIMENTLTGNSKGGLFECAVADILNKNGYDLFFYKNDSSTKEIDFLIQKDGVPIPIEVKSNNSRATSLNGVMDEFSSVQSAYKLIDGNIGISENGVVTMPIYMGMFI